MGAALALEENNDYVGSLLVNMFREKVSKMKDSRMDEGQVSVGYSTGYLNFDFINGTIVYAKKDNVQLKYYSVGITDGSMVMVIGRAGCGKTTWVMEAAGNIIRPFKTSCIFHDDIEGGATSVTRRAKLSKMTNDEMNTRYIYRNSGITIESFYERAKMIHDMKVNNRDKFEYDTGLYDSYGNRIYKLEPTVMIMDSLAMIMPEKYTEEDEMSGQMSATATARANASMFRRLIPLLKSANIILFVINHITEKIEGMVHTQAMTSYLKQGETLPGGRNPVYLSNNLIRMDDKEKLKETEGFGIAGSIIEMTLVKSRSNRAGQSCRVVFDQSNGFDEELSLFLMLKQYGKVKGAGAFLYLGERSDIKFSQKAFKQKIHDNPELMDVFMEEAIALLQTIIPDVLEEESKSQKENLSNNILNRMNGLMAA